MIGMLIRFAIPLVVGYFIIKAVKSVFSVSSNSQPLGPHPVEQDVIEICPTCGHELGKRHKCKITT
jgi:hypothetical protein